MGEHRKLVKIDYGPMDTYWFPDEGQALEDVTVTVQWSPYGGQLLHWAIRPFAPGARFSSAFNPVQYPGRTHACHGSVGSRQPGLAVLGTPVSAGCNG